MPLASPGPTRPSINGQTLYAAERDAYRCSVVKVFCAVAIAICFWYAVPYRFPLQLDPDPLKAAADEAAAYAGSMSRQVAMPLVFLISAYAMYRLPRVGSLAGPGRLCMISLGYIAWACASITWSAETAITGKRLVVFGADALFAVGLARVASMEEIALFGFCSTGIVALIALCADVLMLHTFAPLNPDYRFMGVMTANYQAMNLFVCLVCGFTLAGKSSRRLRWLAPLLSLFAALLFLTRARIGAFLMVAAAILFMVRVGRQWLPPQGRAVALLAACTVLLPGMCFALGRSGGGAVSAIFMMGRHDTENTASLSNRAPLWSELLDSVKEHPVFGFGYEAFWSPERVRSISQHQGWVVPHAHNTYLDQELSLGIVGCLLYLGMVIGACAVAWARYRRRPCGSTLLPAVLLSWLALLGVTESIPIAPYLPSLIAYACVVKMCMAEEQTSLKGKLWANLQGPSVSHTLTEAAALQQSIEAVR